jgi:hypothetical protein
MILPMKICLLFTPFSMPNFVPLGMAYLKSSIEKNLPGFDVKNIDLNLALFERMRDRGSGVSCPACSSRDPRCMPPDQFFSHSDIAALRRQLRSPVRSERGFRKYVCCSQLFYQYYHRTRTCFAEHLTCFLRTGERTEFVRTHLEPDILRIMSDRPDVAGFSIFSLDNLLYALALAKLLKRECGLPVIFGGPILSHMDAREIMQSCAFVDFVFAGDGCTAFVDFLRKIRDGGSCHQVPNLLYRRGASVKCNRRDGDDLGTLPYPDFSDFDLDAYWIPQRILPVMASKGCSWGKCAFCMYDRSVEERPVRDVVEEVAQQRRRYGVRSFFFNDLSITPDRLNAISGELLRRKTGVTFGMYLRPEKGLSRCLLLKAHSAGLRWALLGVETVTQRLLDLNDKGTRVENVKRIIEDCYRTGIRPSISYIVGLPTQTDEELGDEIAFIREHLPYKTISATNIFRLPGASRIFRHPERFGITVGARRTLVKLPTGTIHKLHYDHGTLNGMAPGQALRAVNAATGALDGYETDHVSDFMLGCAHATAVPFKNTLRADLHRHARRLSGVRAHSPGQAYLRGLRLLHVGEYKRARRCFARAGTESEGSRFAARCALHAGECHSGLGQYGQALEQYDKAAALFPADGYLYGKCAELCFRNGDLPRAVSYARCAIRQGSAESVPQILLAIDRRKKNNKKERGRR